MADERVIRPAAIVPARAARLVKSWAADNDVTRGGVWASDTTYFKRFSGPFDGAAGMRGTAQLLGSVHVTWDTYEVTIFRVSITEEGLEQGMTVESLCDELLAPAGLTLASCPRAALGQAPAADPFRRRWQTG